VERRKEGGRWSKRLGKVCLKHRNRSFTATITRRRDFGNRTRLLFCRKPSTARLAPQRSVTCGFSDRLTPPSFVVAKPALPTYLLKTPKDNEKRIHRCRCSSALCSGSELNSTRLSIKTTRHLLSHSSTNYIQGRNRWGWCG